MKTPLHKYKILSSNLFPVVGIGASAGGLDAFRRFLKAIPEDSGCAYVLVQHLDPTHKSLLPSILQKVTRIPVLEITDDIKVQPDHIYIIPSNKTLVANDGVLELTARKKNVAGVHHLPIDHFFKSLAQVHQSHAIAVVLSGNGKDGTVGLKAIRDAGGTTLAQDSVSALHEAMPGSAAMAEVVDYIMLPEDMPAKLVELKQQRYPVNKGSEKLIKTDDAYESILSLLFHANGNDFTHYKEATIRRRIARRMVMHHDRTTGDYLAFLKKERSEQDALYQDLLIPVTSFFRDPKVFDRLCDKIFPQLFKDKPAKQPFRLWVAGCSTGQEAYSMAICLKEFLGQQEQNIQIFATDISQPAIDKARKGLYTEKEVEGISPERLELFFTKQKGHYQIIKPLREKCVFAVHNFLKDAPFGKLDMVSCRNVLIYMSPYLQKRALTTFHYGLNPKGLLLLGRSETVSSAPQLFFAAGKGEKLFTRKDGPAHFQQHPLQQSAGNGIKTNNKPAAFQPTQMDFDKAADAVLLARYMPVGVIVNEALEVVQYRGSTVPYLEPPVGKPSHHLLKLAKEGLSFELRSLLQKVRKTKEGRLKENIPVLVAGVSHQVSIEAIPLPNLVDPHYLVLFRDHGSDHPPSKKPNTKVASQLRKDLKEAQIVQLEKELEQYREDMRSFTAEWEEANDELQSSNEELMSGNEELQSLNEELETSKEELQSTNEQLISLNEQINAAREYSEGIVETIRESVLVLDKELRIKTANNAFCKTFQLGKKDIEGKVIYDLSDRQWDIPALHTLLDEIMTHRVSFSDFEIRHYFPGIGKRVVLFNAMQMRQGRGEEKLMLLAIADITDQEQRLMENKELLTRFQNLVMQAPVAMCILKGKNYKVEVANDYYLKLIRRDKSFIDRPLFESMIELESQGIREMLETVWENGVAHHDFEKQLTLERNGKAERCYFNFIYQPLRELDQRVTGIIVVVAEVTEQVLARKRMESQAAMVKNLMMTAPGFVCTLTGPDHVYSLVNERYQRLFGKRKLKGKPIMMALPELAGQGFDRYLNDVYTTGEPYVGIEVPIKLARDEGLEPELMYFNFSYQPMYDENKTIYSILVFGYEVTQEVMAKNKILEIQKQHAVILEEKVQQRTEELRVVNSELLEKNENLVKLNQELEAFNYISSHDLQEPLRKLSTYASLLQDSEDLTLSEKGKFYCKAIQESSKRMRTLITDLMNYSITDVKDRKFANIDLRALVEEVKLELESLLHEKKANVEISSLCHAFVNQFQFRQVFINLISNAIKFSRPGVTPHIKISSSQVAWQNLQDEVPPVILKALSSKNDYCRIRVVDNGIGFDMMYADKIFEIFQRLHNQKIYKGSGIGLAIVKKIVEHHSGFITANSKAGEGATFSIYLPVKPEPISSLS